MFQGKYLKALLIGVGLVMFQQRTGQPSVPYCVGSILRSAGFSEASDLDLGNSSELMELRERLGVGWG